MDSEKYGASSHILSMPVMNRDDVPMICFAGESTSPHYYSTVHGAIESGLRESQRISDHVKLKYELKLHTHQNCSINLRNVISGILYSPMVELSKRKLL